MLGFKRLYFVAAVLVFVFLVSQAGFGQLGHDHTKGGVAHGSGEEWMEGYTLFVTDAETIEEAYSIQEVIEDRGGTIAVIIPPRVMLGWAPQEVAEDLVGTHNIRHISRKPLWARGRAELETNRGFASDELKGMRFFNQVASGKYSADKGTKRGRGQAAPAMQGPDGLEAPPMVYEDYRKNLYAQGITEDMLAKAGISVVQTDEGGFAPSPGNSDYMAGHAYFFVMYVESDGGVDTNTYNWTGTAKTNVLNEVIAGLTWLANTAKVFQGYDTQLTWVIGSGHCNQPYEPILRPSSHDSLWINDCMADRGYGAGDKFARTEAFNTANRISKNTNWATVSFVVGPPPAPSSFTDGWFAYAYIRGPYSQLTYGNNGWGIGRYDRVNAHETGHLYGALDEYAASGCTWNRTTNNVFNGNCVNSNTNAGACLMNFNDFAMCGYTPGQLGWKPFVSTLKLFTRGPQGNKQTFVPGEAIGYRAEFCIRGPHIPTSAVNPDGRYGIRMRVDSEFLTGALDARGNTRYDSGWATGSIAGPPNSTGANCWWASFGTTIPATAGYGQATATMQFCVEGIGCAAKPKNSKFFIVPGAATTQPSPVALFGPATNVGEPPAGDDLVLNIGLLEAPSE